jgi:hypothetical protein
MAYTFEDILKIYVRRINETWGNTTEDLSTELIPNLNDAYMDFLRETGASWQPPATLTLTGVTATTNKHRLTTALSLSLGEVLSIDEISWKGIPLLLTDKKWIDEQYDGTSVVGISDPVKYAFWGEHDNTANDEATYVAFYPFVASNNSTDGKLTYCKRPALVTASNYTTTYPIFASDYAVEMAEGMAIKHLGILNNSKLTRQRLIAHENKMTKITNHYLSYRQGILDEARTVPGKIYFYGEGS